MQRALFLKDYKVHNVLDSYFSNQIWMIVLLRLWKLGKNYLTLKIYSHHLYVHTICNDKILSSDSF